MDFLLPLFTHHLVLESYKVRIYGSLMIKGENIGGDLLGDLSPQNQMGIK
jgi:hypothetical protein